MRILITGIAGTGKTTVLAELQKRGFVVIDLDATGMCRWKNKTSGEVTEYGLDGRGVEWLGKHGWYCDTEKLKQLLSTIREDKDVFVAAVAENIEEVAKEFDKTFILVAPDEVIKARLLSRTNNHFGRKEEEQNFILTEGRELLNKMSNVSKINSNQSPDGIAEKIVKDL